MRIPRQKSDLQKKTEAINPPNAFPTANSMELWYTRTHVRMWTCTRVCLFVCVCVCVYIYIYIYICRYASPTANISEIYDIHVRMCAFMYVCMHVCIHVFVYMWVLTGWSYLCMYVCMYVWYICVKYPHIETLYVCMICVWTTHILKLCMYVCMLYVRELLPDWNYVCMYVWCMCVNYSHIDTAATKKPPTASWLDVHISARIKNPTVHAMKRRNNHVTKLRVARFQHLHSNKMVTQCRICTGAVTTWQCCVSRGPNIYTAKTWLHNAGYERAHQSRDDVACHETPTIHKENEIMIRCGWWELHVDCGVRWSRYGIEEVQQPRDYISEGQDADI